jgi:ferrous iron transport protein A
MTMQKIPLALVSARTDAIIGDVHAADALLRHLSAMGLSPGARVTVVCADRGSLIVSVAGSRYALSRGMAMKILVCEQNTVETKTPADE